MVSGDDEILIGDSSPSREYKGSETLHYTCCRYYSGGIEGGILDWAAKFQFYVALRP